jgi:methionyl-tRNA synthetase
MAPWSLVKTDPAAAAVVLRDLIEPIRIASILLKPFMPKVAETLYRSFSFEQVWDTISSGHASQIAQLSGELKVLAPTENGKVKPLFPRLQAKAEDEV